MTRAVLLGLAVTHTVHGQVDLPVYTDSLVNGFQDWGWAAHSYTNTAPIHSGNDSISVSATNWQALYIHRDDLDTRLYSSLSFWANGGANGGQSLQVLALVGGTAQRAYALPALAANTWRQFVIPLSSLAAANKTNFNGLWVQLTSSGTTNTFYLDDILLSAQPAPSLVHVSVDAAQVVRTVDARLFGVNTAIWDSEFDTSSTLSLLRAMDAQALRFPGGSLSDEYHWASNTSGTNTWKWATSFDKFADVATNLHAQVFITVNYGTGTPSEAAAWVRYANVTKNCGFKYWEIGNENYGSKWEVDSNSPPHDPFTYANRAKDYLAQMKAADPTIKVGVVVVTGEDSYANYTTHPALNPRTGKTHNGWTPVVLTTLKNLGVTPDFVIYHRYPQNSGGESDAWLLQSSRTWANDAADLRQQLIDYLGASGAGVELVCTENNSVSSGPGKQTTSLVNGLFLADSLGQLMQTEFNAFVWWDLRNSRDTNNNNSATLYGWRPYGDYGIIGGSASPYPTYYVGKLLKSFARGGDQIVQATSDYDLLAAYAARRTNGSVSLLVINKSSITNLNANIAVAGYQPDATALLYSYGIPQDDAARTRVGSPDIAQTNFVGAAANFPFSFPPYSATVLSLAPSGPQLNGILNGSAAGGLVQLQLTGQAGVPYILQTSGDLAAWVPLATNTLSTDAWIWTERLPTDGSPRFYRAVWSP